MKQSVKNNRRQIWTNTLLVLGAVLVTLLVLELGLRMYAGVLFPKMMVWDEKLGWRHASNVSRTFVNEFGESVLVVLNDFGYRGTAPSSETGGDRKRILALGDSFTEGVQVGESDLFTARMEMTDRRFEVINTGVGGYGTVQQYLYLISEGVQLNPDLVLLMFFQNDLTDNFLSYYPSFGPRPYAKFDQQQVEIVEALDSSEHHRYIMPFPFRDIMNRHSYLYYFFNSRIYQRITADHMKEMQQADMARVDDNTRYDILGQVFDRIVAVLDQKGIPFLAVLIPNSEEALHGRSEVDAEVRRIWNSRGIDHISLLDRFHAETLLGSQLYFQQDIHWTKDGHRVAAEEILRHLASHHTEWTGSEASMSTPLP